MKRIISVLIILFVILSIAGCGTTKNNNSYSKHDSNVINNETNDIITTITTTKSVSQAEIKSSVYFRCLSDCFVSDHAWVKTTHLSLIDTNGNVITYVSSYDYDKYCLYENGYSSVYRQSSTSAIDGRNKLYLEKFLLFDPSGNLSCTFESNDTTHYSYWAYDNGLLFLYIFESNMYGGTSYLGIFDDGGNILEKIELPIVPGSAEYWGNGLICMDPSSINLSNYVYNYNSKQLIEVGDCSRAYDSVSNNYICSWDGFLPIQAFTSQDTFNSYTSKEIFKKTIVGEGYAYDDIIYASDGNYYNLNGDYVCASPSFGDLFIYDRTNFRDGYSAIFIRGADGYEYVTIIDKSGEVVYEPVIISEHHVNLEYIKFYNGIIYNDITDTYIDIQGNVHSISELKDKKTANMLVSGTAEGLVVKRVPLDNHDYIADAYGNTVINKVNYTTHTKTFE